MTIEDKLVSLIDRKIPVRVTLRCGNIHIARVEAVEGGWLSLMQQGPYVDTCSLIKIDEVASLSWDEK